MAEDSFKYTFKKRFDVPEEVRIRAQQWMNAGGPPSGVINALEGLEGENGIELTDKQMQSLYESADEAGRKSIDESRAKIASLKDGGRQQKFAKKRLKRELLAQALGTEYHEAGGKFISTRPDYNYKLNPDDLFGGTRKNQGGAIQGIDNALQSIRETNADVARGREVPDLNEVRLTQERANRPPSIPDAPEPPIDEALAKQKSLADRMRKAGMTVVKKGGPKLAALLGGPIGWGIAGASTMMDAADAYSAVDSAMNPESELDFARQKYLADRMREFDVY